MGFHRGPTITRNGLVLMYDFANPKSYVSGSSTIKDISRVSNNEGTIVNNGSFSTDANGSLVLNGTNERVDFSTPTGVDETLFYTIEVWFKPLALPNFYPNDNGSGSNAPILGDRYGSSYQIYLEPEGGGTSFINVCYDDSRTSAIHRASASISTGSWVQFVHVGLPYSGSQGAGRMYFNGEVDRNLFTSSDTNGYFFPSTLRCGYDARADIYSNHQYGLVRVYDRELTAEEVRRNFDANKSRFGIG